MPFYEISFLSLSVSLSRELTFFLPIHNYSAPRECFFRGNRHINKNTRNAERRKKSVCSNHLLIFDGDLNLRYSVCRKWVYGRINILLEKHFHLFTVRIFSLFLSLFFFLKMRLLSFDFLFLFLQYPFEGLSTCYGFLSHFSTRLNTNISLNTWISAES